jgi:hypothetical protein
MQPDHLVEGGRRHEGRFAARPTDVNPLDAYTGPRRAWRRLRLKEWVGFTLMHPDIYCSMIIQDAHYIASSEIYAYDRAAGVLHQHAANAGGGSPQLPARLYGGHCAFSKGGHSLRYDFDQPTGSHRIAIDIAATATAPAFSGELILNGTRASAPLSVSAGLAGGAMYTNKVIYPAGGVLRVGDREVVFDPARDLAILDEHRSFLPYRTSWVWGTFATQTPAGIVGANFAHRTQQPGTQEESCLWTPSRNAAAATPGRAEPLADITFTPASDDPKAGWHIASADGRLDVTFEPEGRKDVKLQLGLFAMDYYQAFGRYRGVVRGADGTHEISGVHGVCETMKARL